MQLNMNGTVPEHSSDLFQLIEFQVPFCAPVACSYVHQVPDNASLTANGSLASASAALWDCLPTVCRRKIEGFFILLLFLSVLVSTFNGAVLAANLLPSTRRMIRRNPTMKNYSMYVLSMACADLLVGAVVLPTAVAHLRTELTTERLLYLSTVNRTLLVTSVNTTTTTKGSSSHGDVSNTLVNSIGVMTHLAVFVSMYTLAAASADRFYTSTKPISSRSLILSSSSFRRKFSSNSYCVKVQRSSFLVVVIWMIGVLFSMIPLLLYPKFQYNSIGYTYVALTSSATGSSALPYWYFGALAFPLVITWLFSSLICFTLWKRKRKLKSSFSSRNSRSQTSSKRTRLRRRPSMTESHVCQTTNNESEALNPESRLSDNSDVAQDNRVMHPKTCAGIAGRKPPLRKIVSSPADPVPTRKRRPSSIDMGLIKQIAKLQEEGHHKRTRSQPTGEEAYSGLARIDDSFVAKKLLCRRSWGGYQDEVKGKQDEVFFSKPLETASHPGSLQRVNLSGAPSPSLSLKFSERKLDFPRNPARTPTRLRRKSSVFRARELLRSKTLESNIAKTLLAVVIAISVSVIPLLVVLVQVANRSTRDDLDLADRDVTATVVSMTVLLSNSLWNCLIYGVRMPYFRRSVQRQFRKVLRRLRGTCCCTKLRHACVRVRRILSRSQSTRSSPRSRRSGSNRDDVIVSDVFSTIKSPEVSRDFNASYVMRKL